MKFPKLSVDLPMPSGPWNCWRCGSFDDLLKWQECDDDDKPDQIYIRLCKTCSAHEIAKHPRLYIERIIQVPAVQIIAALVSQNRDGFIFFSRTTNGSLKIIKFMLSDKNDVVWNVETTSSKGVLRKKYVLHVINKFGEKAEIQVVDFREFNGCNLAGILSAVKRFDFLLMPVSSEFWAPLPSQEFTSLIEKRH